MIMRDSNNQIPMFAPLLGMILDAKIFTMFFSLSYFSRYITYKSNYIILKICKIILFFGSIHLFFIIRDIISPGTSLTGLALQINPICGYTPIGLFSHKSEAALLLSLAATAALTLYIHKQKISYVLYFLIYLVAIAFSSSLKEFIAVTIMTIFITKVKLVNVKKSSAAKCLTYIIAITALAGIFIVFSGYITRMIDDRSIYLTDETVRVKMYTASYEIAIEHIPLGSGAGTFGSYPSRTLYYSPLYEKYGLSSIYGATEDFSGFLMDTWWPKVIAEAGFLGGLTYILIFISPFFQLAKDFLRKLTPVNTFGLFLGILLLLTSTASAIFTHSLGILVAALFLLMYNIGKQNIPIR